MCFWCWVQDAQFSIGQSSKFSAALWYPSDGNPWHGSAHYTASCDWVAMDVVWGYSTHKEATGSWNAASAFAFVISVVALAVSVFVGYLLVSKSKSIDFTPIDRLWILSFHFSFDSLFLLHSHTNTLTSMRLWQSVILIYLLEEKFGCLSRHCTIPKDCKYLQFMEIWIW